MEPMLASKYAGQDPTGWHVSEKLDGVRAVWDGARLVSRNGNAFNSPDWFTKDLPDGVPLDGELWAGRGGFQKVLSIIKSGAGWESVKFVVFDAPDAGAGFEIRFNYAGLLLSMLACQHAELHPHFVCDSAEDLRAFTDKIVAEGGEGVMLRAPWSAYEAGRSAALLKLKPVETDEAVVIGHEDGEGRLAGKLGALVCRWRGNVIRLGTGIADAVRSVPPAVGELVTFRYSGLTDDGFPKCAAFVTCRNYE